MSSITYIFEAIHILLSSGIAEQDEANYLFMNAECHMGSQAGGGFV
jgi:hypothetical protein